MANYFRVKMDIFPIVKGIFWEAIDKRADPFGALILKHKSLFFVLTDGSNLGALKNPMDSNALKELIAEHGSFEKETWNENQIEFFEVGSTLKYGMYKNFPVIFSYDDVHVFTAWGNDDNERRGTFSSYETAIKWLQSNKIDWTGEDR